MTALASYFSDPLDPARSLQLNNRYWPDDTFRHLDLLGEADTAIRRRRFASLRRLLPHVKAFVPARFHRSFVRRLAHAITYPRGFDAEQISLSLPDTFVEANRYRGTDNRAFLSVGRFSEISHVIDTVRLAYRARYGRDVLRLLHEVRYVNATHDKSVVEMTQHGSLSDFHFDERGYFTCIVYLEPTTRENGGFSYVRGSNRIPRSSLLTALHNVVSFDMQLETPAAVADLPLELRCGTAVGNFLDHAKLARLAEAQVDVVGGAGEGILFNGSHTLHRGGKPTIGQRTALVISVSGVVRRTAHGSARQLLEYLWR